MVNIGDFIMTRLEVEKGMYRLIGVDQFDGDVFRIKELRELGTAVTEACRLRREALTRGNHADICDRILVCDDNGFCVYEGTAAVDAKKFAAQLYGERKDEFGLQAVFHPIQVADQLRFLCEDTDETILCGALLHDCLLDGLCSGDDLYSNFGEQIRDIVKEITAVNKICRGLCESFGDLTQDQIETIKNVSEKAKIILLSDMYENICRLYNRSGLLSETLKIQSKMFDVLKHIEDALPHLAHIVVRTGERYREQVEKGTEGYR